MFKKRDEKERAEYLKNHYPQKTLTAIADDLGLSRDEAEKVARRAGVDIAEVDYKVGEYDDPNYKENLEWIMERPNTKLSSVQAKEIDNSEYYVRVVKKYNRKNYKTR